MYIDIFVTTQDPPEFEGQLNDQQYWLWRNDALKQTGHRGWYITKKLGAEFFDDAENIIAWGPSRHGEPQTFPTQLHVPYNRAKRVPGVDVQSYVKYLEGEVSEGRAVVADLADAMLAYNGEQAEVSEAFEAAASKSALLRQMLDDAIVS